MINGANLIISLLITLPALLLLPPQPNAAAAWIQAAGTPKAGIERVEYDPATHRFDTKLNIDTVHIRYLMDKTQTNELDKFLSGIPACATAMKDKGSCRTIVMTVAIDGIMRIRHTPQQCLNSAMQPVCIPAGITDDSWSSIQEESPEYYIYRELVLRPERGGQQKRPGAKAP